MSTPETARRAKGYFLGLANQAGDLRRGIAAKDPAAITKAGGIWGLVCAIGGGSVGFLLGWIVGKWV